MADSTLPRLVNLNKASPEEIMQLPGVGRKLASRIVAARPYKTVRDLILIDGVSPKLYASLLPLIAVTDRPPRKLKPAQPITPPESTAAIPVEIEQSLAAEETMVVAAPTSTADSILAVEYAPVGAIHESPLPSESQPDIEPVETVRELPSPPQPQPKIAEHVEAIRESTRPAPPSHAAPTRYVRAVERTRPLTYLLYGGVALIAAVFLCAVAVAAGRLMSLQAVAAPTGTAAVAAAESPTIIAATSTEAATSIPAPIPTTTRLPASTDTPTATLAATETPAPTHTPLPTDTPQPAAPANVGVLAFVENFDPPQFYWGVGNTGFSKSNMLDGRLTIRVDRPSLAYVFGGMEDMKDFYYQASATVGPCGDGDHYGLLARAKDDSAFEGKIRIQSVLGGQYSVMAYGDPNPAVNTGDGAVNVLAVRMSGGDAEFFVNDALVETATGLAARAGHFGVYAKAFASGTLTVSFDDVTGWSAP